VSIKAYVGRMGSGKTYEVVSVVILNALRRGRRVITNIAGLNFAACADLLVGEGIDPDQIGRIVTVPHERVTDADFWLSESVNTELKETTLDPEALRILPGDLVCLDEIWRFWQGFATKDGDGKKRPDAVMNFMRMHRHFTHPATGVACDLAIITQDVMDISRQVRAVIEETYGMEKLTAVGSTKRYRVDVCQGGQSRRVMRQIQRSYEPKYFGLYSSHSGRKEGEAGPKEENIDGRGNLLQGALFKFVLPVGLVVAVFAVYGVYGFFNPKAKDKEIAKVDAKSEKTVPASASRSKPESDLSDSWRVVGWIAGNPLRVVLSNGMRQRIITPPAYQLTGLELETFLPSGEAVASWTGNQKVGLLDKAAP
jgi:zona occludens toxin